MLVGTGAVNHDELVKKASEALGAVPDEDPSSSLRTLIAKVRRGGWWCVGGYHGTCVYIFSRTCFACNGLLGRPNVDNGRFNACQSTHCLPALFMSGYKKRLPHLRHLIDSLLWLLACMQEPALYTGSYVHDRFPDATECAIAVAFKGAAATDADSVPLMVMQTMLGASHVPGDGADKGCTLGVGTPHDTVLATLNASHYRDTGAL